MWRGTALLFVSMLVMTLMADPSASVVKIRYEDARPDLTGPVANQVRFSLSQDSRCTLIQTLSGVSNATTPVRFWTEHRGPSTHTWAAASATRTLSVHETETGFSLTEGADGAWTATKRIDRWWTRGSHVFTTVASNLSTWSDATGTNTAFRLVFHCDRLMGVSVLGDGTEVVLFDSESLRGDQDAQVAAEGAVVSADRADRLEASLVSDLGSLRIGHRGATAVTTGTVHLEHPGGTASRELAGDMLLSYDEGPGTYSLEVDRVAAGAGASFVGALYGMDWTISAD